MHILFYYSELLNLVKQIGNEIIILSTSFLCKQIAIWWLI